MVFLYIGVLDAKLNNQLHSERGRGNNLRAGSFPITYCYTLTSSNGSTPLNNNMTTYTQNEAIPYPNEKTIPK